MRITKYLIILGIIVQVDPSSTLKMSTFQFVRSTDQVFNEVAIVGSTMIDFVAYTPRIPLIGETLLGNSFVKNFGGKGANQAVMVARLGGTVRHISKVGGDNFGDDYIAQFTKESVLTDCLLRSQETTGIACITVENSGGNTIVIIPGANSYLTPDEVKLKAEAIEMAKVLVCQNEIPLQSTLAALEIAKASGTISVFNPAPAAQLSALEDLIHACDILCPNEVELATITGIATDTDEGVCQAATLLLEKGPKAIVVTLGARGALLCTSTGHKFFQTTSVCAVDTVGAGDSFIGTLALNIARGSSLSDAIIRAIGCASDSVTRPGAQCSYPVLGDLPLHLIPPLPTDTSKASVLAGFLESLDLRSP